MKFDYDNMSIDEICDAYFKQFGDLFCVEWDDDHSFHRQEIIDCIESGTPQDMSSFPPLDPAWGVLGVDYVL